MAAIAVTYTFSNSTTADASQVNQNFQDIVDGLSNGTKDISISALTVAGNASFSGNTTLGNASGDDLTVTASLASSIPIKTTNTYDIGTSTLGLRALYFGANSQTVNIKASGSMSATWTFTLPVSAGTSGYYLKTDGSGVSSWSAFTAPTIQTFTSGTGTYTTPANVKYIRIRMIGGGGGGGGGSTASNGSSGGTGGNTTFGSSLLTANGGTGGGSQVGSNAGGQGGTATIASPAYGTATKGAWGNSNGYTNGVVAVQGGSSSPGTPFGGGGGAGDYTGSNGQNGIDNTGAGGASGQGNYGGGTGGAGGFIDAIIPSPSATYSYAIGAAGTGGSGGGGGTTGGAGGSGYIEVTEYYQ